MREVIQKGIPWQYKSNVYNYLKINYSASGRIVFGKIKQSPKIFIDHAWVEKKSQVIDPTLGFQTEIGEYYYSFKAVRERVYTLDQLANKPDLLYRYGYFEGLALGVPFKEYPLTRGMVALVDADMFYYLNQWKWRASGGSREGCTYALREEKLWTGEKRNVWMHRVVMALDKGGGKEIDHIDGYGLHNWRSNLRLVTHSQNSQNHRKHSHNSSGYIGVGFNKFTGLWCASRTVNGKVYQGGTFADIIKAAKASDSLAKRFHKEFATLNFPRVRRVSKVDKN